MLYIIFITGAFMIGGYFAFRYVTLLWALGQVKKELKDIQQDLTQNQMLHLPVPNAHLGELLSAMNNVLEETRRNRQDYEKREKEFQRQIENISHDLRTPLTVILGYLRLIKKSENNENKELCETIGIMEQKAETLKNLVTQFYDYSRLYAGDLQLALSQIDVSRQLRESLMGNYLILEQAHLQVEADIPDFPVRVTGEESAFHRIFQNLFQNAGRYGDTFLHIALKEEKNDIVITFINDTQVLSEEDVPHLFERFYMQAPSRNRSGTGLGLTVAKALAEEMGAELKAYIPDRETESSEIKKCVICFELRMKRWG